MFDVTSESKKLKFWMAGTLGFSVSALFFPALSHAVVTSTATISAQEYSADSNPGSRVEFTSTIQSSEGLSYNSKIPKDELHFYSFFETDSQGDRSFDLDTTVARFAVKESGHLWIGRTHPLNEGYDTNRVTTTGAIGANWVQNQSNALQPRVAGWIGAGAHYKEPSTGLNATIGYSPVYLPNFGPSVQFSESADATGSRFAHLPPLYITLNGQQLPLRYRINTGDIMNIVLQPQFFAAVGHDSDFHRLTLMGWSAPNPNPQVSASGILKVNSQDANVLVTAVPSFPRQKFLGAQWSLKAVPFTPNFEAAYETVSQNLTLSASIHPSIFFEGGYMTTFTQDTVAAAGPSVSSPMYAKNLFWGEFSGESLFRKFRPSLRIEQHTTENQQGQWLNPKVGYVTDDKLMLFASASFINGEDYSYFGTWRNLDSISFGATYKW